MKLTVTVGILIVLLIAPGIVWSQDRDSEKEHENRLDKAVPTLFESAQVINLETAATIGKSILELQHLTRFEPPLSSGWEGFWGIDGPRTYRVALAYGLTRCLMFGLGRSNVQDNVDLQVKYGPLQFRHGPHLLAFAVQAGAAWNTTVEGRDDTDDRNFQYFAQGIVNVMAGNRFGFGVVPSIIYNSDPVDDPYRETFALGAYAQFYVLRNISVLGEFNSALSGFERDEENWAFGTQIDHQGHFFTIFVTNTLPINPSQFLVGVEQPFFEDVDDNWHLGLNIIRHFRT